jgi:hypothetical protein
MFVTSSSKFYCRHNGVYPETLLVASAIYGFEELGAEVVPFHSYEDLAKINDFGPETGVVGYISDVHYVLRKLGKEIPGSNDYPEALRDFLKRDVRKDVLGNIRNTKERVFIKPVGHKVFTGFIWDGSDVSRRRVVLVEDTEEIWISHIIEILSEYRCIILDGEIIGCRHYHGDPFLAPDRNVAESAVKEMGRSIVSYCLDFAVTRNGTVYSSPAIWPQYILYTSNQLPTGLACRLVPCSPKASRTLG